MRCFATLQPSFVSSQYAVTKHQLLQDPFDRERNEALSYIKNEGKKWISVNAKGGSAPGQATKRMYVAVDAVLGHVTSYGAAPLPKSKVKFVETTLKQVGTLATMHESPVAKSSPLICNIQTSSALHGTGAAQLLHHNCQSMDHIWCTLCRWMGCC